MLACGWYEAAGHEEGTTTSDEAVAGIGIGAFATGALEEGRPTLFGARRFSAAATLPLAKTLERACASPLGAAAEVLRDPRRRFQDCACAG